MIAAGGFICAFEDRRSLSKEVGVLHLILLSVLSLLLPARPCSGGEKSETVEHAGYEPKVKVLFKSCAKWSGQLLGNEPRYANDVQVRGHHAFLADGLGLQILDVRDPRIPKSVARVETRGFATALCLAGSKAYVVDSYCPDGPMISETVPSFGLQVFDVTDPSRPAKVNRSSIATHNHLSKVAVAAGWAYLLDAWVMPVDLTDPSAPRMQPRSERNATSQAHQYRDLCVVSNRLYAVGSVGLHIYDLTVPAQLRLLGSHDGDRYPSLGPLTVNVAWPYAYVGGVNGELQIVDVTVPSKPRLLGQHILRGVVTSVDASGNHVFVTDDDGVKALDVSQPDHPIQVGYYPVPGAKKKVLVNGKSAYVCAWKDLIILEMEFISDR